MSAAALKSRAAWSAAELRDDTSWIYTLDEHAQRDLAAAVRKARDREKTLFDYERTDFDFGAAWPIIAAALQETKRGRGIAIVHR